MVVIKLISPTHSLTESNKYFVQYGGCKTDQLTPLCVCFIKRIDGCVFVRFMMLKTNVIDLFHMKLRAFKNCMFSLKLTFYLK